MRKKPPPGEVMCRDCYTPRGGVQPLLAKSAGPSVLQDTNEGPQEEEDPQEEEAAGAPSTSSNIKKKKRRKKQLPDELANKKKKKTGKGKAKSTTSYHPMTDEQLQAAATRCGFQTTEGNHHHLMPLTS